MSMLGPTLVLALREIRRHLLRSFLTVLGIVIGVAAVVTMVTLGNGATAAVREQISGLGVNILQIRPGQGFGRGGGGPAPADFDMDDVAAIRDQVAGVVVGCPARAVVGHRRAQCRQLVDDRQRHDGRLLHGAAMGHRLRARVHGGRGAGRQGRVRDRRDGAAQPVPVRGSVGQRFRLRNLSCEVIGTLVTRGQGGFGNDQDDVVLMPIKTVQRRITGNRNVRLMMVKVDPAYDTATVTASIQSLLRERRNIRGAKQDDFNIFDTAQISQTLQGTTRILTALLGAVAAVSLLVGGIGIMNIMLVSVTERTREIGIRLAIGAVGREVLLQFLVEAIVLACLGGVIGLLLALLASWAAAPLLQVPFLFDVRINVIAFVFSALIGVIFGYFPARRAAQLNPIDALRHE